MGDVGSRSRALRAKTLWRLRRLQSMSVREIVLRLRDRARLVVWRGRATWPPPRIVAGPRPGSYRLPPVAADPAGAGVVEEAERLLEGSLVALGQTFSLDDVRWGLDPQSGRMAPLAFGPLLDYRDPQVAGNSRNTWELNRHQHLTTAALAYAISEDERFARFVRAQLESWLGQNPFPLGVNWCSSLELGLRLISWVWVARFLAGSRDWEPLFGEHGILWPAVYRQQWMISRLRSVGSSANNHLIGEMAGLFVSAVEWPWFAESAGWARSAQRSLEDESRRQYYPSGVNREQAFGYHLFATELLLLAALEGERACSPFSRDYHDRLRRAVTIAHTLVGPGGQSPAYGDCDDGVALGLPGGTRQVLDRITAVAAEFLGGVECAVSVPPEARLASALQSSGLRPAASRVSTEPPPSGPASRTCAVHDAGLFVMTSAFDGEEVFVLADAGELGYLSIAAHGHADALSFTLSVGDEQLLVDPGTYAYHYDREGRAYFRGTRAHNTICIDGQDQSEPGGPFLWMTKARTTVEEWRESAHGASLLASHDGYERLSAPVTHRRKLTLHEGRLTVDDELTGVGRHDVEWRLHVAPQCDVRLRRRHCDIIGRRHRLSFELDDALHWRTLVGDPQGGWYSRAFNQREPTTTLVGGGRLSLPAHIHHVLQVSR